MSTLFAIKTDQGYYRWDKSNRKTSLVPLEKASIYTPQQITELEMIMTTLRAQSINVSLVELSISEHEWSDIATWKRHQAD